MEKGKSVKYRNEVRLDRGYSYSFRDRHKTINPNIKSDFVVSNIYFSQIHNI